MTGNPDIAKKTIDVSKEVRKQAVTTAMSPSSQPAQPPLSSQPVLSCHYLAGPSWHKKDFMSSKMRLSITEDPHNSDIPVGIPNVQNISITMQKLLSEWYVLESSNSSVMTSDGIPTHQAIFKPGMKHVLFIEKTPIVFSYSKGGAPEPKTESLKGKPEKGEFSLLLESTGVEARFKKDAFYVMGPTDFCDFKLPNETALVMIFHYNGSNYLRTIHTNAENPVTVDGVSADTPIPLFNDSKIVLGKNVITFHAEQVADIAKQNFVFNPEKRSEKLCLLCIDEETAEKYSFALPPPGKALNVGRDSHCEIHIDSKDVSRKHSQVIMYERSALVFDCYSTNGTYVNGEKIAKRMLHPGDIVCFGDTKFLFCYLE